MFNYAKVGKKIEIHLLIMYFYIIFEFHSKISCISEIKINRDLFCISLDLHYLCTYD